MVTLPLVPVLFVAAIRFCLATETIGIHWGQVGPREPSLYETCASGRYKFIAVDLLRGIGGRQIPELYLSSHCPPASNHSCSYLSSDIMFCQEKGITVVLSIRGDLASAADAKNVSEYLWNTFLGGRSSLYPRPLGNASLDGVNVFEISTPQYWDDLARSLLEYRSQGQLYLAATIPCSYPNPNLGKAIEASLFDYLWVSFHNDTTCEYEYANGSLDKLIRSWNKWIANGNAKIFPYLSASPVNIRNGFIPAKVLVSIVLPALKESPKYGGIMLWSKIHDDRTGYSSDIQRYSESSEPHEIAPPPQAIPLPRRSRIPLIVGATLAGLLGLFLTVVIWLFFHKPQLEKYMNLLWPPNRKQVKNEMEYYLESAMSRTATRFPCCALAKATDNFSRKLGEGGCGSVFKGVLNNGITIAVKLLNSSGPTKKSFIAEVETVGSIHHINLVRLVGYCAENSEALLVYEYMCNGSLDRWIFNQNSEQTTLDWKTRRKIILGIAKGLLYLHDECRQKVIHLDIKPQNILLDENFTAKVSDFGLSTLVDRGQNLVMTTMRGTPGYMAPEWQNSVITEKVDVYSFGVVILETLCGRKNLDWSQPTESRHLLSLFKEKAAENKLTDLVDSNNLDMQAHKEEVMEMMRVAAWCLQNNVGKRPSMSMVAKAVSEGLIESGIQFDYDFFSLSAKQTLPQKHFLAVSTVSASCLSGPR